MKKELTTEELLKMWGEDGTIDLEDTNKMSLGSASLHSKYMMLYVQESEILCDYEYEYVCMNASKEDYYMGRVETTEWDDEPYQILIENKKHLDSLLKVDSDLFKLKKKVLKQKIKTETLDKIVKEISNMSFRINNINKEKAFTLGM